MSFDFNRWALETEAPSATAKAILLALAVYADRNTGECWPSQATLSKATQFKPRAIVTAMAALEQAGLISRTARWRKGGSRSTDVVTIGPNVQQMQVSHEGKGASGAVPNVHLTTSKGAGDAPLTSFELPENSQQENQGRPRATKAARDSRQAEAQHDDQAEARSERRKLINGAVRQLCAITGRSDHSARAAVGAWLSRCNDEAFVVVGLIEEADRREVTDPSMWIEAQLRARNEQGREDRSPRAGRQAPAPTGQAARRLKLERIMRERENGTDTARPELRVLDGDRGISGTDDGLGDNPVGVTRGHYRGMPYQVGGPSHPSDALLRIGVRGTYDSGAHSTLLRRRPPGGAA